MHFRVFFRVLKPVLCILDDSVHLICQSQSTRTAIELIQLLSDDNTVKPFNTAVVILVIRAARRTQFIADAE